MLRMMIFNMLLIGSCSYALLRGGAPERLVGGALLAAYAATMLSYSELTTRFDQVEIAVLAVDVVLLSVLVGVALRADRAWPLVVAGLHLCGVGAHLLKILDVTMIRVAYAVMIAIWSYPMLIALAAGTRRHRLRLKARGYDLAWSIRHERRGLSSGHDPDVAKQTADDGEETFA